MRIVYHKDCFDGEAGVWAFKKKYNEEFLTLDGQSAGCKDLDMDLLLKEKDTPIYFVDICPSEEQLQKLLENGNSITILDHHKTNQQTVNKFADSDHKNLITVFDMNRSGCQIAWDYLFGYKNESRPEFIDYIADRDLWTWVLEDSKFINNGISFYGIKKYNDFWSQWDDWKPRLIEIGKIIDASSLEKIEEIIKNKTYISYYENNPEIKVSIVTNTDYAITSRLGNLMCEFDPTIKFAIIISNLDFEKHEFSISLRSKGFDVSEIARKYGGGGHNCAAGCSMKISTFEKIFCLKK